MNDRELKLMADNVRLRTELAKQKERMLQQQQQGMDEQRLKEWLDTGLGQLRNVSLVVLPAAKWNSWGAWKIQPDGLTVNKCGGSRFGSARTDMPFPVVAACPSRRPLFYFEVKVTQLNCLLYIGLSGRSFPLRGDFVGHFAGSLAVRSDGRYGASDEWQPLPAAGHQGPKPAAAAGALRRGDIVGCGLLVLPTRSRIFFTRNGKIWGKPIARALDQPIEDLFPTVSANKPGAVLEANFGGDLEAKPFRYDLAQLETLEMP